jgi:hypothetical protein
MLRMKWTVDSGQRFARAEAREAVIRTGARDRRYGHGVGLLRVGTLAQATAWPRQSVQSRAVGTLERIQLAERFAIGWHPSGC